MTTEPLVNKLTLVGFTVKEARVYIALLALGSSTASAVAREAEVNRSSTYVVLNSLKEKGYVKETAEQHKTHFIAVSPDVVFQKAQDAARKQQENLEEMEKILPELKGMHKEAEQAPKVEMYQGAHGVRTALWRTHESREKEVRLISSGDIPKRLLGDSFGQALQNRVDNQIKTKSIHPDNQFYRELAQRGMYYEKDEDVFLPEAEYTFPADIAIYDDTIRYVTAKNGGLAIMVKSKEIADCMKVLFDKAWNEAKRREKQNNNSAV